MDLTSLDKTLTHYRDRVRSTVDEWMSHYRQVMGISIPAHLRASLSRSSSPSPGGCLLATPLRLTSCRSYTGELMHSRPISQSTRFHTHPLPSRVASPFGGQRSPQASPEGGENMDSVLRETTPISPSLTPPSVFDCGPERPRGQRSRGGGKVRGRSSSVPGKSRGCPVALHNLLLKNFATMSPCKCDKRRPPYVCDLEYDAFLSSHVPSSQVVVVCVLSSVVEGSCPCEPMLDALHYSFNRQRFSPCTQMYVGGRLVYADSVFNGYGTTKKDFLKQVDKCTQEVSRGHYIPTDYRFTSHSGGKHPASTSWAYPLSGVLSFLVPFSPSLSTSSHLSSGRQTASGGDEDNQEMSLQLSRLSGGLRSGLDLSHSGALSQLS
ncbi:Uncharacterized protein C3orf20 [Geodia barretti]|uniref:Uncharacterized protein C3orf20 n=2 Tax=Geodia barretti TaxID=519541 RepID=A0AA35RZS0_GEOBA|nr:Uncharacterized protein C3orf20 [Geodia barretti]